MLSTLGPRAKYSSCLYPTGRETLAQAEECMLESYCEKAKLADGVDILDLGCGTIFSPLLLRLPLTTTKIFFKVGVVYPCFLPRLVMPKEKYSNCGLMF